jgi:methylated-DNA-[protein]-cysteine S-methyltransferase
MHVMTADALSPTIFTHSMKSPIGTIHLAVDRNGAVLRLSFRPIDDLPPSAVVEENRYACGEVAYQLDEYFHRRLKHFDLDVVLEGTDFQLDVWARLQKIPFGTTLTYGEVAQKIGRKYAAQAVGRAVGINPVPIIIPCHRVIPKSGGIGEYALNALESERGRQIKEFLLELERQPAEPFLPEAP